MLNMQNKIGNKVKSKMKPIIQNENSKIHGETKDSIVKSSKISNM